MASDTSTQDRSGDGGEDVKAPPAGTGAPGHPAPAREHTNVLLLWFGLLGAPLAWSVQELVNYPIAAHTCYPRMFPLGAPTIGHGALWGITMVVSLATLALGVAAGLTALHAWRRTRTETGGHTHWALDTGDGRTRFMALSGVLTSVLFLLAMLVHTASILALNPCW